jgi:hypothetical protein
VAALSHRERCDLFLSAVNGDALPWTDWKRFLGRPVRGRSPRDRRVPIQRVITEGSRQALARIIKDRAAAAREFGPKAEKIADEGTFSMGRRIGQQRLIATSIEAALYYALTLFLDPELEFGQLLRRCGYCPRFALGSKPETVGKPPAYYCNDEHRALHRRKQSAEKMREWRKEKAK